MATALVKSAKPAPPPPLKRRYFPGAIFSFFLMICLLAVLLGQMLSDELQQAVTFLDQAFINLLTALILFVLGFSLFIWFVFRSTYPGLVRLLVFLAIPLTMAIFLTLFKVEEVTGNMVPRFGPRFSRPKDEQLAKAVVERAEQAKPEVQAKAPLADPATTTPEDFPQFLGPGRNNFLPGPQLSGDWKEAPPKEIWRRPIGAGWCGFVAVNGFAVTMEQRAEKEWVTCYEVATGEPVWGTSVTARHENILGGIGPRSTPTIAGGNVYALGATGILRCLDGANGKVIWEDDLHKRFQLKSQIEAEAIVMWGRANSPLVTDGLVIVPAGGPVGSATSLVAFDATTGDMKWQAGSRQISYSSPVVVTLGGVRQILIVNEDTVTGNDIEAGTELWSHPWPGRSNGPASSSQSHVLDSNRVLLSKGYGEGAQLISVRQESGIWRVETLQANRSVLKTKFTNVTIIGNHAYGLSDGILECVEVGTLKRAWRGGRFGHGQVLGVGDKVLVLGEAGELALVEARPDNYNQLGKIKALNGKTWNNLCLHGKRLLIRNGQEAACYELP